MKGGKPWRLVGREAEFPVIRADNGEVGDVQWLLHAIRNTDGPLLSAEFEQGPRYRMLGTQRLVFLNGDTDNTHYSAEVGKGTVELITGPCETLHELRARHEEGVARLLDGCARMGPKSRVLGYGIQPFSEPSLDMVIDRQRYTALNDALSQDSWKWYSVTAADQTHVDVYEAELPNVLNVANALAPAVVALCGNSPIHSGSLSGVVCSRQQVSMHMERYGMPERENVLAGKSLKHWPIRDVADWVASVANYPFLLNIKNAAEVEYEKPSGGYPLFAPTSKMPFDEHVLVHGLAGNHHEAHNKGENALWERFRSHEHYVWHAARPRWKQRTVEFRAACQQPHSNMKQGDHMAANALSLGMTESASAIWQVLHEELAPIARSTINTNDVMFTGGWSRLAEWYSVSSK